jgi:CDP-diacylglycerol--serine O-phosphatidyltransferase
MLAIWWASHHQFDLAATVLVLGFMTDVVDGALARKLGVTSSFGLLFDFFADYLYYVVAPCCLAIFLVADSFGPVSVFLLTAPAVGGALRYSRKAGFTDTAHPGLRGSPGLPTNVCAFYVFSLVFLWREQVVDTETLGRILMITLPILAALMWGPRRYPWLTDYLWIFVPMAVGLYLMPFVQTTILASITLSLIVIYVIFAPFLIPQHETSAAGTAHHRAIAH